MSGNKTNNPTEHFTDTNDRAFNRRNIPLGTSTLVAAKHLQRLCA
ncbi:hypothetical protein [Bradyrhizobium sp. 1(2017)]|nr:hypothetical protein [Bradyrhizobium sp. 1(2017)]